MFSNWSLSCALLFGIVGSHLFLLMWNCNTVLTSLKNTLTETQKKSFQTVYKIRLGISITSFLVAGILTAYIYYKTSSHSQSSSTTTTTSSSYSTLFSLIHSPESSVPCWKSECKWLFMWFGLYVVFYMICPKFKYMMKTGVTTIEQAQAWFKVYQCMQSRFLWGFLLGMVFYTLLVLWIQNRFKSTNDSPKTIGHSMKGHSGGGISWNDLDHIIVQSDKGKQRDEDRKKK
uniref:Uncharacterized protein n=1 Tax=viral metagenome TaxID=1070528 RepID=A0A6C0D2D6_9ZZZZ